MASPDTQKMRVTFEYDVEIYEDDPDDVFMLVPEEEERLDQILFAELGAYNIKVIPILLAE